MAEQSSTVFERHLASLGQEYAEHLTSLERELFTLSGINETQQVQIDSLTASMQTLNDENNSLCEQILQHQTEIMDLQALAAKQQQQIESWSNTAAQQRKTINEQATQIEQLNEIIANRKRQIETLSAQNNALSTQIETLRHHNNESQNNHNRLTGLIAKFKNAFNLT